ncbi:MAG: hypothetical protein KIT27_01210 [Legionellales bacterium]|nr:hypothetical protein [Legionellales bacterium]
MKPAKHDLDFDDAKALTKMVMRLFEHWKLTYEEQASLLGLSVKTNTSIARYKRGDSQFSLDRDKRDRVAHLLTIHKYLRMIYPKNRNLAYAWPKSKNVAFGSKTPVEVITEDGFEGLLRIRNHLEHYLAS